MKNNKVTFSTIPIVAGAFFILGGKLGPLGHLPGDVITKKNYLTFIFPLATSLMLSVGLTVAFYLIRYFKR